MYHIFFIHSSADEHLGNFHVLAVVNSASHIFFFFNQETKLKTNQTSITWKSWMAMIWYMIKDYTK